MIKIVLVAVLAGGILALRRRRCGAEADAALWAEATAPISR
jgi:hypothetical protein